MRIKRNIRAFQVLAVLVVAMAVVACTEPSTDDNQAPTQSNSSQAREEASGRSAIDRVLEEGVLRVGTTGDWQPMTYLDPETDEYQGYYVDIVRDLAADMGVEVEWVRTTWQDIVSGIAAGRYDITTGASFNLGRARQGSFTAPIAVVGTVPLTLSENVGLYESWSDINQEGIRVAATLGTTQDQQAQLFFPNAELVRPDSGARDYQEVIAGRADVSITSNIEAGVLAERFDNLEIINVEPRATLPNGMIVDRGDVEWLNYVNSWITMKEYQGYFEQKAQEYGLSF